MERASVGERESSRPCRLLVGLVVVAVLVRGVVALRTWLILPDGIVYATMAEQLAGFGVRGWWEALSTQFPPLFPLLAVPGCLVGLSGETATLTVSLVMGSLLVVPAFVLGWQLGGERRLESATLAGLLVAVHPYLARPAAEVLADSTLHLLVLSSLASSVLAMASPASWGCWRWLAVAGSCTGLAWLARPEGLAPLLAVGMAVSMGLGLGPGSRPAWRLRASSLIVLVVSALLVAGPYLIYIRMEAGAWTPTLKKDISHLVFGVTGPPGGPPVVGEATAWSVEDLMRAERGGSAAASAGVHRSVVTTALYVLHKQVSVIHPLVLVLAALGVGTLLSGRRDSAAGAAVAVLLGTLAVDVAIYMFQKGNVGYLSRRHVAMQAALAAPLAGVSLQLLWRWRPGADARKVLAVAGLVACVTLLPKTFQARYRHKSMAHEVAAWLGDEVGTAATGVVKSPLQVVGYECQVVGWYAGVGYSELGPGSLVAEVETAREAGAKLLVVYVRSHGERQGVVDGALAKLKIPLRKTFKIKREGTRYHWLIFDLDSR